MTSTTSTTTRSRIQRGTRTTPPPSGDRTPRRRAGGGATTRRGALVGGLLGAILLLLPPLWAPAPATAAPDAQAARDFIRTLGDRVLELLQSDLDPEERRARLVELLNDGTDLDLVGRLVLGQHWRTAEPAQREQYTELFRHFVMQNLASRLDSYQGQSYTVTGAQVVDDRDAVVGTQITRPGAPPLRVDWRLRESSSELLIIDVIVEGVSMVVSQRAEFASVIGNSGMEGLLARLRQQVNAGPA